MEGRRDPQGGMGRQVSGNPGCQAYVVGLLPSKGVLEAAAQLQPSGAPSPGPDEALGEVRGGPARPYLAERMITRASSSRASISRAVTFLVPGSNCSTFSACGVSRGVSRWPGPGT